MTVPPSSHLQMLDDRRVPLQVSFSELALAPRAHPLEDGCEDVERGDRKGRCRVSVIVSIGSAAAAASSCCVVAVVALGRPPPAAIIAAAAKAVSTTTNPKALRGLSSTASSTTPAQRRWRRRQRCSEQTRGDERVARSGDKLRHHQHDQDCGSRCSRHAWVQSSAQRHPDRPI